MGIDGKYIKIETTVNVPVHKAWNLWNMPEHITKWCTASEDWHTIKAENDLVEGGKFSNRMEAKDGSFGFDFWGIYDKVNKNESILSTLGDGRKMIVLFESCGESTKIIESFEPEKENSLEQQKAGWQSILDNFKKYAENHTEN